MSPKLISYHIPTTAFLRKPSDHLGIVLHTEIAEDVNYYELPRDLDPQIKHKIDMYIANYFDFKSSLSEAQIKNLGRYIGGNSFAWKALVDRFKLNDKTDLVARLFVADRPYPKPDLTTVKFDTKKLCKIFALRHGPKKYLFSQRKKFDGLGFSEDQVDALHVRALLYSWTARNKKNINQGNLSDLESNIKHFLKNFDKFTNAEKRLFIKTATPKLIDRITYPINVSILNRITGYFEDIIEKLQDTNSGFSNNETGKFLDSFRKQLNGIEDKTKTTSNRDIYLTRFRDILAGRQIEYPRL